jgi:hypothetical protein
MSVSSWIYLFLKSFAGSSIEGAEEAEVGPFGMLWRFPMPPGFLFKNMMFSSWSSLTLFDIGAPLYISTPEGNEAGPVFAPGLLKLLLAIGLNGAGAFYWPS